MLAFADLPKTAVPNELLNQAMHPQMGEPQLIGQGLLVDGEDASVVGPFQKLSMNEAQLHGTWLTGEGQWFVRPTAFTWFFDVSSALHIWIFGASLGEI